MFVVELPAYSAFRHNVTCFNMLSERAAIMFNCCMLALTWPSLRVVMFVLSAIVADRWWANTGSIVEPAV